MNDSMWYRLISSITFICLTVPLFILWILRFWPVFHSFNVDLLCVNAANMRTLWTATIFVSLDSVFNSERFSSEFESEQKKNEMWFYLVLGFQFTEFIVVYWQGEKKTHTRNILAMNGKDTDTTHVCNVYQYAKGSDDEKPHAFTVSSSYTFFYFSSQCTVCNIKMFFFLPYFKLFYRYQYY